MNEDKNIKKGKKTKFKFKKSASGVLEYPNFGKKALYSATAPGS